MPTLIYVPAEEDTDDSMGKGKQSKTSKRPYSKKPPPPTASPQRASGRLKGKSTINYNQTKILDAIFRKPAAEAKKPATKEAEVVVDASVVETAEADKSHNGGDDCSTTVTEDPGIAANHSTEEEKEQTVEPPSEPQQPRKRRRGRPKKDKDEQETTTTKEKKTKRCHPGKLTQASFEGCTRKDVLLLHCLHCDWVKPIPKKLWNEPGLAFASDDSPYIDYLASLASPQLKADSSYKRMRQHMREKHGNNWARTPFWGVPRGKSRAK